MISVLHILMYINMITIFKRSHKNKNSRFVAVIVCRLEEMPLCPVLIDKISFEQIHI